MLRINEAFSSSGLAASRNGIVRRDAGILLYHCCLLRYDSVSQCRGLPSMWSLIAPIANTAAGKCSRCTCGRGLQRCMTILFTSLQLFTSTSQIVHIYCGILSVTGGGGVILIPPTFTTLDVNFSQIWWTHYLPIGQLATGPWLRRVWYQLLRRLS